MMVSESHVVHAILKHWGAHPRLRIWRQNTGVATMGARTVRFGVPGQADISGVMLPEGRRVEIECKTAKGKQSDDQRTWQAMIERFGGLYILARSLSDVDAVLIPILGAR